VLNAQNANSKVFQKVTAGVIFGAFGNTSFSLENGKPFNIGYNLMPNITVYTPITFHNFMYGLGDNSIQSLNGYFLNDTWDTYFIYSKSLNTKTDYLGLGIEKMLKIGEGEGLKLFILGELGTNFKKEGYSATIGLLLSVQNKIWAR
jgi:hypothetical protein